MREVCTEFPTCSQSLNVFLFEQKTDPSCSFVKDTVNNTVCRFELHLLLVWTQGILKKGTKLQNFARSFTCWVTETWQTFHFPIWRLLLGGGLSWEVNCCRLRSNFAVNLSNEPTIAPLKTFLQRKALQSDKMKFRGLAESCKRRHLKLNAPNSLHKMPRNLISRAVRTT